MLILVSVPIPKGYSGVDNLPKQRELLINLFNVDNGYVRTPGIDSVIAASGDGCRGAITWPVDERAYFVQGTVLYRLNSDETRTNIGTVSGTADVIFSPGQIYLVILVKGGSAYTYDSVNGFQTLSDPDYVPSVSVDFINGRHVFVPADGEPAIYSAIEDALANEITIDGFIDAQQLPDRNRHCVNVKNKLVIWGADSAETFSLGSDVSLPFVPMTGTRIETGYVSGGSRYKGTYVFIGRDRQQDYGIFAIVGQGQAEQISNPAVTEDLNNFTQAEIEAARVNRYKHLGVEFIVWSIGDYSYSFYDGNWIFQDSNLNGTEAGPWRVNGVAFAYGRYYVGDAETNNIGRLSSVATEYGSDVEYQIDTFYRTPKGDHFAPSKVEVDVLTGQNGSSLGLSLSKDGRVKSDYSYRNLGIVGDYQKRIRWQPSGGLGYFESYMGISLRGTGAVQFSLEAINVD